MPHLTLYRKYRPRNFSDVVGQEHVTKALKSQIVSGHIGHAYLFTGIRGTGKTTLAKIFAKAVNCLEPHDGDPCGECANCCGIDNGSILDVSEIDAASNNGVDNIRDIIEEVAFLPSICRYRVYIIDEVHMFSQSAYNALLKTIEEPPEHVIFILATTETHKVPATILSRCQRYDLKRIPASLIVERIKEIAAKENFSIDDDAALLIARSAEGSMRDALSITEGCISLSENVTYASAKEAIGLSNDGYLPLMAKTIINRDAGEAVAVFSDIFDGGAEPTRVTAQLTKYFRDIMVTKGAPASLKCTPEELAELKSLADMSGYEDILAALTEFSNCMERCARSADPRLELEVSIYKLCAGTRNVPSAPEKPAKAAAEKQPAKSAEVKTEAETERPVKTAESRPVASGMNEFAEWSEVITKLNVHNPMVGGFLRGSHAYIEGKRVLIDARESFLKFIRVNDSAREEIKSVIAEVTGVQYAIGPYTPKREAVETKAADRLLDPIKESGTDIVYK